MAELQPCPFCGGSARMARTEDADGLGFFLFVKCDKCRAGTADQYVSNGNDCPQTRQEVRDRWNQRAATPHGVKASGPNNKGGA